MKVNCVCQGLNESCRYCSGSGTIDDKLARALFGHQDHWERGTGAVQKPNWKAPGGTVYDGHLACTSDYVLSLEIADPDDKAFLRRSLIKVEMDRSRFWLWYADSEKARKLLRVEGAPKTKGT